MQAPSALGRIASLNQNEAAAADMTLVKSNTLKRKTTVLMRTSTLNEAETEFDWRDRLKQWKQVSQSAGAVTSFADMKVE